VKPEDRAGPMKPGPKPQPPKSRGAPVMAYPERLTICPVCGIGFVPSRHSATYCSDTCRQRARVARLAAKPPA